MATVKRLNKVTREFNVGISTIVEYLATKGFDISPDPNTKITEEHYSLLTKEFSSDVKVKQESDNLDLSSVRQKKESISIDPEPEELFTPPAKAEPEIGIKVVGKIDLSPKPKRKEDNVAPKRIEVSVPEQKEKPKVMHSNTENVAQQHNEVSKPAQANQPAPKPNEQDAPAEAPKPAAQKTEEAKVADNVAPQDTKPNALQQPEPENKPLKTSDSSMMSHSQVVENNVKVIGKIDLSTLNQKTRPDKKTKEERQKERYDKGHHKPNQPNTANTPGQGHAAANRPERGAPSGGNQDSTFRTQQQKLSGPTVVGKISLPDTQGASDAEKKKRKRIKKDKIRVADNKTKDAPKPPHGQAAQPAKPGKRKFAEKREEVKEEDVQKKVKETLSRLTAKSKNKSVKHRRDKRDIASLRMQDDMEREQGEKSILRVTEFISVSDIASLMDISVTEVISSCMSLGLFVSINQRLDAETIVLIAEEFGFKIEFTTIELQEAIEQVADNPEDLIMRPPIVTVMGHVDHGKTSLLDYIRKANVIAGEAGGITQHIGAYSVSVGDKKITFLDTPGHEAFTAMRARGAQVTDIAIIVIAADDSIMPQTKEAINHASAAGVPMIFALNKVDKEGAMPDKIREGLANMNYLVEEWGGKYQSQEISAKFGLNVELLLEKVLLEAEILELTANPAKPAIGTVIESELDKGRGYVSTILVQAGTLKVGDYLLAGMHTGKVKAMFNERNQPIKKAGPSEPVIVLGLNGAPQAGDKFNVMASERDAKEIANKREQLQREQNLKTQKHVTLDEIGRRIAIGNFQQLNIIVKGDVDGSVEALSDSLIKLSTEEIQVNIIHKAVGAITESDILLATASDAIVIGFQVRPSSNARKLAEQEGIDIRMYSIIYDAINEIRDAMSGMLSPEIKEEVVGTCEIQETFKITKVGTIAGCIVQSGKIKRNCKIRIVRDGIVVFTGTLGSLKRFKDDVKEVTKGYECGLNIHNYNDINVGDIIEAYEEVEYAREL
jgi:translation initiation factor IF-2